MKNRNNTTKTNHPLCPAPQNGSPQVFALLWRPSSCHNCLGNVLSQ